MNPVETLISALQALELGIEKVLQKAQCVLQEHSAHEFAKSKAGVLGPLIGLYAECFKRVDVNNKDEFESLIKKNFRHIDLQDQFSSFEDTEGSYNQFLTNIDQQLAADSAVPLKNGDALPLDLNLQRVQDHQQLNLRSYLKEQGCSLAEFVAAGGHVVVVSFGVMEGAEKWLHEVNCPFEMLLDPERKIYQSIGLGRSLSKVWNTETIAYYGSQVKSQRKLPQAYKDIIDDPHQMGGDIVLNPAGVIKMAYPSQKAQDRPSVQSLLDALKPQ